MDQLDLKVLSSRESDQVEWKENVADSDDVVETLSAFANDWSNLGGGYVVCGAREEKDEHGFPTVTLVGLSAAKLREVEGKVLTACRDRVSPSIAPLVQELPTETPDRRVLVFVMPSTRSAHLFRKREEAGKYYVRISRETREARNGILRELLVRKGAVDPWDRRVCSAATINDLDLLALRDALQRMGVFHPDRGIEEYLSDARALSPFVPALCFREPLTNVLRPRNFAMLLFGRNVQSHIQGGYSLFSIYPGTDRSEPHAERNELAGTLVDQARRLIELLDVQSYVAFDKTNRDSPNAVKYPPRALHEAMINALAHRDYEIIEPTRVTVFSDRVEVLSPGSLPTGISVEDFREGRAPAKWRNQSLAWFLSRLQLAQAEGQGIPTILRSMREEGCPPPRFHVNEVQVVCTLPAHPRHALAREHRNIEEAISLGEFERAQKAVLDLLSRDSMNVRTIQLFAEVQRALNSAAPVREFLESHRDRLNAFPPVVLTQLADVLTLADTPSRENLALARTLYLDASRGRVAEREVRQVAIGLSRAGDESSAIRFLNAQMEEHPEFRDNPFLLRIRGNAYIGQAKTCSQTGKRRDLPPQTKRRAWEDCRGFLKAGEGDLRRAVSLTADTLVIEGIEKSLDFVRQLREIATPPERRQRTGQSGTARGTRHT
ncbi:MAG: ATP-binding protein [Bryobacteraceae bacterium]|nr:ATP-binding protein [Bryobacteraceae bacterium]